jgi:Kef-type K+ transport system membrane component KefB
VAGVVWQLVMRNAPEPDRAQVESKVEGLAFGVFVPVFFVYTGITFDLQALIEDPRDALLVPVFLMLLLVVRGLPALLSIPAEASGRERGAMVFLGATGLPIIVAVTAIGVDAGILREGLGAALVGAGMLSVLLFPLVGMSLRGVRERDLAREPADDDAV